MPPFDTLAVEYDRWFQRGPGRLLFPGELAALRLLLQDAPHPLLEIGVGTGRFGTALGVDVGLDMSKAMLDLAHKRGIASVQGTAEHLPFRDATFGSIVAITTLCFIPDPAELFSEARRVLTTTGILVVADLVRGSPWADQYEERGRLGNALYKQAHFYRETELADLLLAAGFDVTDRACSVFQPPTRVKEPERGWWGYSPFASFVALRAVKAGKY